jgi:hypothetical protein
LPGLKVLLTNTYLAQRGGTELYIRDLATGLLRIGHQPFVYSPRLGGVADEIRALSIPVVDTLDALGEPPDVIHGQHHLETMTALWHFPDTPALYVSHGYLPWQEAPPLFPRILRYVVVGVFGRERLICEYGIDSDRVTVVHNFVDLSRFRPRSKLPARPRRALLFGNWPTVPYRDAVQQACADRSITLDVAGLGLGTVTDRPEELLHQYDLVFALGRSALEAMATGAAVILAGSTGLGPSVTTSNFDRQRSINFAIRALTRPCDPLLIGAEIDRYDPVDALLVTEKVQQTAGLDAAVDKIVALYEDVLTQWRATTRDRAAEARATSEYLRWFSKSVLPGVRGDVQQSEAERDRLRAENAGLREDLWRAWHTRTLPHDDVAIEGGNAFLPRMPHTIEYRVEGEGWMIQEEGWVPTEGATNGRLRINLSEPIQGGHRLKLALTAGACRPCTSNC